jgi:predicted O-linked N-acetylglucosamine transferase (SPINDLY family)
LDRVLENQPGHAGALHDHGLALATLGRHEDAIESFNKALHAAPGNVSLLTSYGAALLALGRVEEALAAFDKALTITPDRPEALKQRTAALRALGRCTEALDNDACAIAAIPHDAEALFSRGNSLWALGSRREAIESLEKASAFNHPRALSKLAICRLAICDWANADMLADALRNNIAEANFVDPLTSVAFGFEPAVQLKAARVCVRIFAPLTAKPFVNSTVRQAGKLRISYLSSNFRQQPVAVSIAELLERHDRARFEVIGVSYGPSDASDIRARIANSFDRFHDVASDTDRDIAGRLNDLGVHIAVDLNGLTGGCRPGVLAYRPAPIQVSYLGFAGTTGTAFTDYILADATVLPFDQQPFFTEKIVHLPGCYHANDATRRISPHAPTRRDLGLPDRGLVFCCFNQSYKIAAPVFDVWMRLLAHIPGSVLWLSKMNDLAQANLRREAAARGIDPERLIFAPWIDRTEDHLARHRAADLFLDTLPYNAHSTAIDALWAGLPVVTCAGSAFAGRVGASLLKAAGLPQLVTDSLEDYEALAFKLATDHALLSSTRRKLADNRPTCALFDGDRFRRHVEAAYATMWDIHRRGGSPRSFRVEPDA